MKDFNSLSLDEKRNELNKEVLSLLMVIDAIRAEGYEEYYNYQEGTGVSEDEFLTKNYELIKKAKEKLVDIFNDWQK